MSKPNIERMGYMPGYHIADEGVLPVEALYWASGSTEDEEVIDNLLDKLNASMYVNGWINDLMVKAAEEK